MQRIVLKVGSSLLTDPKHGVHMPMIERIVDQVCMLHARGIEVCLVSSGAVSLGRVSLANHQSSWLTRLLNVHEKQAAAAVGQPALMQAYHQAFAARGLDVAQMLLTRDDLSHRRRYLNASNTAETLFSSNVVPIVNENDTVVVAEIKFGDNDALAALVGRLVGADLVVLATDVDGLFDANPAVDPKAVRIAEVRTINEQIRAVAKDAGSAFGTGGMKSKVNAADIATRAGVMLAIVPGSRVDALAALLDGEDIGTLFYCVEGRHNRRKHWIADLLQAKGQLFIDAGAEKAMLNGEASLLPIGLLRVQGAFDKGECVEIHGSAAGALAKGLVNYSSDEMITICGLNRDEIQQKLGFVDYSSVVHRDNLVMLKQGQEKF